MSRTNGKYICFNHSCDVSGSLVELVKFTTKKNEFQARRLIISRAGDAPSTLELVQEALRPKEDFEPFSQDKIDQMVDAFWKNEKAVQYMKGRGFTDETLRHFEIGFSAKKNCIAVPMHDPNGQPIGVIGRLLSAKSKGFKNSDRLPTSKTLWNLHRAKRTGDTVIVVEASFDGMRDHQAGFPNVVGLLGGHLSPYHIEQLDRHFSTIIIGTDFDTKEKHFQENCRKCRKAGSNLCLGHNPGRDLGASLAEKLTRKRVLWMSYENGVVYPHGAKDQGDMTDDEIRQCVRNAVSDFTYRTWGLY